MVICQSDALPLHNPPGTCSNDAYAKANSNSLGTFAAPKAYSRTASWGILQKPVLHLGHANSRHIICMQMHWTSMLADHTFKSRWGITDSVPDWNTCVDACWRWAHSKKSYISPHAGRFPHDYGSNRTQDTCTKEAAVDLSQEFQAVSKLKKLVAMSTSQIDNSFVGDAMRYLLRLVIH